MMDSNETKEKSGKCGFLLRQFLLVVEMIGLEACLTLEVILMIANVQTLGVPIRYSSLSSTVSAATGIFLIPSLGILVHRKARSKSAKARILIFTSSFQLLGSLLVFIANTTKLIFNDGVFGNNSAVPRTTMIVTTNFSTPDLASSTSSPVPSSNSHMGTGRNNSTIVSAMAESVTSDANISSGEVNIHKVPMDKENIEYYAILAMVGYCLIDLGYDSSNCFLKTYALASTTPKDQSSIIVKSILISSFGGCLVAVLGSLGLGDILTAGTSHDSNAAQCALISALCFTLLLSGLITTLTTGFCCPPSSYSSLEDTPDVGSQPTNEKSRLVISKDAPNDLATSQQQACNLSNGSSKNSVKKTLPAHSNSCNMESGDKPDLNTVLDAAELSPKTGIAGFFIRHKNQILINMGTFFTLGALYSFEVFAVNFIGDSIFKGDPRAEVGSEEYKNYLQAVEVGSLGTLIFYVVFTIVNVFQEFVLNKFGWKVEMLVACTVYVVLNLICALTATLWAFYLAAVWTGIFRTAVMTIPYLLANQLALEDSGKDSGVAMATVAAMLPLGFSVCSAVMGPLIDATGNSATPIYYTAVNTFLGTVAFAFLRLD